MKEIRPDVSGVRPCFKCALEALWCSQTTRGPPVMHLFSVHQRKADGAVASDRRSHWIDYVFKGKSETVTDCVPPHLHI